MYFIVDQGYWDATGYKLHVNAMDQIVIAHGETEARTPLDSF